MKISVTIQYFNRKPLLLNTLNSILHSEIDQNDVEVIIVDDASDKYHNIDDIPNLFPGLNIKIFSFDKYEKWWACPVIPLNKGISMATGDVVVLLCAEVMFVGDILMDIKQRIKPNDYLVYATLALTPSDTSTISNTEYQNITDNKFLPTAPPGHPGGWYQHSIHRNTCFNFCSAMMRDDLLDIGGFDERFGWGVSHGDDNFLDNIKKKGMNIISIDEPMTYHQYHVPMIFSPVSDHLKDNDLLQITRQDPSYKVTNSFL
jgi:glycosyltransferase involved in cell wall biosynthesis